MQRKLPHFLNCAEVERIMSVIPSLRDRALFALMYDTGMRVSEAVTLTREHLNLKDCLCLVMGKGSKERFIPFSDIARKLCVDYLASCGEVSILFPVSRQRVWQLFKYYAKLAGITKPVHPHTFRHSIATHLLNNGMNLRYLQEFLGHSSLDTTQIYTHVSMEKLKRVHLDCHPRGALCGI